MNKKNISTTTKIFIAMILACVTAAIMRNNPTPVITWVTPLGTIFLNLIKLLVVPVTLLATIRAIISIKDFRTMKTLGVRTYIYALVTNAEALLLGIGFGYLCKPFFPVFSTADLTWQTKSISFSEIIISAFPSNIITPLSKMAILPLVVIALLIGVSIRTAGKEAEPAERNIHAWYHVFMKSLGLVMILAPVGVYGLFTPMLLTFGWNVLSSLLVIFIGVYGAIAFQLFIFYPAILKYIARVSPIRLYKTYAPLMSFAFTTTSSTAAIPINLDCANKFGFPTEISSYVVPLNNIINKDGTELFIGFMLVFFSHVFSIDLSIAQVVTLFTVQSLLTFTPGIPGGILISMSILLPIAGLPIEGIAITAGIDKIFDMGRTTVNVMGYAVCTAVMSRYAGKLKDCD